MRKFNFQEWFIQWTLWGIGWSSFDGRGWDPDEITIVIGPLRFVFISWSKTSF